ncbi:MAG: alpha/beta hydrolase [Alphaproteobacteria bacterium]|nr:alpha/beta hydrolase [Alphaproteobacteria bacterium]
MPFVFRDFNQAELDAAYNNSAHVGLAKRDAYLAHWAQRSDELRVQLKHERNIPYGPSPREILDWVPCGKSGAPTFAFIHGGYWQSNDKETSFHIAGGVVPQGINFVNLEYTLAPAKRMDDICQEIRRATQWLIDNLGRLGGDPNRLFIGGHSAGGHLTAVALGNPRVAGGMSISGLFDLEPIRLSVLNKLLAMDVLEARRNSPIHGLPKAAGRLFVAVGGGELSELQRQSVEFHAAWRVAGLSSEFVPLPSHDHFSVIDEIALPTGILSKALVRLMGGR